MRTNFSSQIAEQLLTRIDRHRRGIVVVIHMLLIVTSNQAAFYLRFDGPPPEPQKSLVWQMLPWLLLVRGLDFAYLRLYEGLWRYTSIHDARNIVVGVVSSSLLFFLLVHYGLGATAYSRSIFVIDALLLILLMGGIRLSRRIYRELWRGDRDKGVLIYGAGDAGEMIVRDMITRDDYQYEPIGFVDDDPNKVGQRIHGIEVLGTRKDLPGLMERYRPDEVLIAIPRASAVTNRAIVRALEPYKVPIRTLPNLRDLLTGKADLSQIRPLAVEDLLARPSIGLDVTPVRTFIGGKRVLVTGAGGSIGSELCRQIASLKPSSLILYERYENGLHAVTNDLVDRGFNANLFSIIGDITDAERLTAVVREHQPQIVFHAAAHKHVPLMEHSPCEAVKNNVRGTRLVAQVAVNYGVERFILISTDKAVNPTSIMGATKRVAELVLQMLGSEGGTEFCTVRFGNVLGSNGSVVPRFLEQIRAGGPVTITDPAMRRYFMLISEAVQLVLHAAAHGKAGAVYVLDMGEQVKVLDMARTLIRLAGFVPDVEIPITFIGRRPGEKLEEELVGSGEEVAVSNVEKVLEVRQAPLSDAASIRRELAKLEAAALEEDSQGVIRQLGVVVPSFDPQSVSGVLRVSTANIERIPAGEQVFERARLPTGRLAAGECPSCGSQEVHRSRPRTVSEKIRKVLSEKRLHRCHSCGWRDWRPAIDRTWALESEKRNFVASDLTIIDTSFNVKSSAARSE